MSIYSFPKFAFKVLCSDVCVQCVLCVPGFLTIMNWKQTKRVASFLLLGFILIQVDHCRSDNREVMIGGLFGSDEDEHIMNSFKYAVYRMNHDRDLLTNMKLTYDIKKLMVENRFEATKRVCDQIAIGTIAIFGPLNQDMAAYTGSACSSLRIPHLETRVDASSVPPSSLSIGLHPDTDLLAKACLDVIKFFGWSEMLIIYGDQAGLLKIQSLLRATNETTDMTIIVRQADIHNMRDVLKEAKTNRWQHIVAELNLTETALLLKMALQEGMIDSYHHFVLNNMDIELLDLEDYRHNYVNLTGFRLLNYDTEFTNNILYDMRLFKENTQLDILKGDSLPYQCALIFDAVFLFSKALRQLERNALFSTPNITCESNTYWSGGKTLYDYINSVKVKGLTGEIKMNEGRRTNFKLDIMELGESALQKTGTWDDKKGVNITKKRFRGRGVFGNKTLVVSTNLEPPYAMYRKSIKGNAQLEGNDRFEGFCIDLLKEIAKLVGFDYKIVKVPDDRYGNKNSTGHWDGIVNELLKRRADLSVAALTISYEREQYIDFTKPFLNLGISILFKVPKREKPGLFSFMNPLAIEIWIYVVAAYFVVSITIFVLARFSPYEWYNPHPCNPETDTVENIFTLNNSFWFCVGTLMQQGSDVNPRAVSTRIVGSTWWLFTLIIISSYTANLAAFLTVERMVSPIESADDLSKQTDISYGTLEGGSTMSFFNDSSIETYQRMWNFMQSMDPSPFTKTVQEGIDRVLEGGYAYLMESTSIEYNTQRNCNLMQVGGLLDSKGYGIATPMNSPLKDKLSMAILSLQEDGVIQKLYNKWWKSSAQCFKDEGKESKANALGVENVGGIFVVLLGGLTLAIIVALVEFIVNSRSNAREDKQSLCSEMGEELRFAIRCGSSQKLKYKKKVCLHCKAIQPHTSECALETNRRNSANGVIHMRENRNSMISAKREMELDYLHEKHVDFGAGGYLHVEYSDTET